MKIRKRIMIDEDLYKAALDYAALDNRTFSELIHEAIKQMMRRYPKEKPDYNHAQIVTLEKQVKKLLKDNTEIKAKIDRT